jgi:hypothetical protein
MHTLTRHTEPAGTHRHRPAVQHLRQAHEEKLLLYIVGTFE